MELCILWFTHFPAKIVTWSIMRSLPRYPFTNMAEGCNSGKQGLKSHSLLVIWVHMLENLIYELKKIYIKISGNRFCYIGVVLKFASLADRHWRGSDAFY